MELARPAPGSGSAVGPDTEQLRRMVQSCDQAIILRMEALVPTPAPNKSTHPVPPCRCQLEPTSTVTRCSWNDAAARGAAPLPRAPAARRAPTVHCVCNTSAAE